MAAREIGTTLFPSHYRILGGGWVELFFDEDISTRVFGQFEEQSGAFQLVSQHMAAKAEGRLDTRTTRWISFESFRRFANGPGHDAVAKRLRSKSPRSSFAALVVPLDDLTRRESMQVVHRQRGAKKKAFVVPNSYRKGQAFYEEFARLFKETSRTSTRPGVQIAEEFEIPLGTIRTWIRECRLRGLLPGEVKQPTG